MDWGTFLSCFLGGFHKLWLFLGCLWYFSIFFMIWKINCVGGTGVASLVKTLTRKAFCVCIEVKGGSSEIAIWQGWECGDSCVASSSNRRTPNTWCFTRSSLFHLTSQYYALHLTLITPLLEDYYRCQMPWVKLAVQQGTPVAREIWPAGLSLVFRLVPTPLCLQAALCSWCSTPRPRALRSRTLCSGPHPHGTCCPWWHLRVVPGVPAHRCSPDPHCLSGWSDSESCICHRKYGKRKLRWHSGPMHVQDTFLLFEFSANS